MKTKTKTKIKSKAGAGAGATAEPKLKAKDEATVPSKKPAVKSESTAESKPDSKTKAASKPKVKPKAKAKTKTKATGPDILPELPMDDPEFRSITMDFMDRLEDQMITIEKAIENEDFEELASLAHWLRGAGGTVGLPAFTHPAQQMEDLAEQGLLDEIESLFKEISDIKQRVRIPAL